MAGRSRLFMYGLPLISALALGAAILSIVRSNTAQPLRVPTSTPPSASVSGTPNRAVIAGLGLVEPAGREVNVATRLAGVTEDVRVTPGARVKAGDVLFQIDAQIAAATVEQRKRDLTVAEARARQTAARAASLEADIVATRDAAVAAEAERDEARDLVRIAAKLVASATTSERELTRRRNLERGAEAKLAESKARLLRAEAELALIDPAKGGQTLKVDEALVAQAAAALALAEAEYGRAFVRAPSDGTILVVNVRPGEFATQGEANPPIVMGQLDPLHVRVDIDEADLPRFKEGTSAVALRRGAPDIRIPLTFIRAEPLVAPKRTLAGSANERVDTRVLQVIYAADGLAAGLRPGQIVDVFIDIAPAMPAAANVIR
jgi:HlyD family secretion protein